MSQVKRLYVEMKPSYAVKAKELAEELNAYLSIDFILKRNYTDISFRASLNSSPAVKSALTLESESHLADLG